MSEASGTDPKPRPLRKQWSWSPDTNREEVWARRKGEYHQRRGCTRSLTDDDFDELKACFELGFGFDSPDLDPKLSDAFPALEFYCAVNRQYSNLSRSSSSSMMSSDCESPPLKRNTSALFEPGKTFVKHNIYYGFFF